MLECDFCRTAIRSEANVLQITKSDLSQEKIALCDYDMKTISSLIDWRRYVRRQERLDALSALDDRDV